MRRMNRFFAVCVLVCLIMTGIIAAKASVSEAAEPAVVLQSGLVVYPAPAESGVPVKRLGKGDEVLTRVEIVDSQGVEWCDVLNRGDETMLGYVRCDGLKMMRPEKHENWREVPSPEDVAQPGEQTHTPSKGTPADRSQGQSPGQPVQSKSPEPDPRQLKAY